ncbi:uncharacterized protein LOC110847140 isoform X1 [Folsomia candida]|uniref:uncharacterized protein LOC110847140 isoform X1 n=1 Tax=Folsomia candida TaxID=158441 RepID=UPI00160545DC|nr:uncharacterized protein LOC110847140 isoform X1 [Folsomia candida]
MNNDPRRRLSRPELSGISAIFNPRKLRRNSTAVSQLLSGTSRHPSVVVTDDNAADVDFFFSSMSGLGLHAGSSFAGMANGGQSVASLTGGGSAGGGGGCGSPSVPLLSDHPHGSGGGNNIVTIESSLSTPQLHHSQQQQRGGDAPPNNANIKPIARTIATIKRALFSKTARKLCCGLFLSVLVGCCWTILFHSIKRAYITMHLFPDEMASDVEDHVVETSTSPLDAAYDPSKFFHALDPNNNLRGSNGDTVNNNVNSSLKEVSSSSVPKTLKLVKVYEAPFFTSWLLSICTVMFYPIHQLTVRFCSCMGRKGPKSMSRAVSDAIQGFRERGMTLFQFIGRCSLLCLLWLITLWLICFSLKTLKATQVLALFATTTSFLYILSWTVLHIKFVGIKILAVILSNMGIALFAYMDGQTYRSTTIVGVIFGAAAAATSAVFKVSLKKFFGFGATISQQVALIFSVVGIIAIVVLWPVFVTLYFSGLEVIIWSYVPWELILCAVLSFLVVAMLENFGVTCTFEFFISIGLLMAIPFSAVLDHHLYHHDFEGMCLAGIWIIGVGFCVVLLPEDWPEYITRIIRFFADNTRWGKNRRGLTQSNEPVDTRTSRFNARHL